MTRVLLTGVRGKTGSELARRLVGRPGIEVVGGTRDPRRVARAGVTAVVFDWDDPGTGAAALEGADAVYLVRPDIENAPERIASLLADAPHVPIVLLSELGAGNLDSSSWVARVERAVTEHARHWTLLRPSWFMQVFTDQRFYRDAIRRDGRFVLPAGGAGISWIDARDIAAVAERALLDSAHAGHVYALTGPEAVDLPATAKLLSSAAGRTVEHDDAPVADVIAGLNGWDAQIAADVYERVRAGAFAAVTDDVTRVTGMPARPLEAFVAEHAKLFARRARDAR